jgi:thioredoxin 1
MDPASTKAMSFSDVINGETPVLVDFFAEWCAPCKMMAPILQDLKSAMGDRLTVIKVDTDRNPQVAAKYQIRGVPTMILFHKGNILWQQAGVVPLHQLKSIIESKSQRLK